MSHKLINRNPTLTLEQRNEALQLMLRSFILGFEKWTGYRRESRFFYGEQRRFALSMVTIGLVAFDQSSTHLALTPKGIELHINLIALETVQLRHV